MFKQKLKFPSRYIPRELEAFHRGLQSVNLSNVYSKQAFYSVDLSNVCFLKPIKSVRICESFGQSNPEAQGRSEVVAAGGGVFRRRSPDRSRDKIGSRLCNKLQDFFCLDVRVAKYAKPRQSITSRNEKV